MAEFSFFKVLGIGYIFAIILLVWELVDISLHKAAMPFVLPFTAAAMVGFVAYFLFVYFAPPLEEEQKETAN